MHEFLSNNRDELARRCRVKVGARPGRSATEAQLHDGVPLFLNQLIRTLQIEQTPTPLDSRRISGPAGGAAALSEVSVSAAQHGKDLMRLGLTVDQVVNVMATSARQSPIWPSSAMHPSRSTSSGP